MLENVTNILGRYTPPYSSSCRGLLFDAATFLKSSYISFSLGIIVGKALKCKIIHRQNNKLNHAQLQVKLNLSIQKKVSFIFQQTLSRAEI